MQLKIDEADALPAAEESEAFRGSFEAFYRREIRAIVGLAYVLSGSRRAAEDLAQEAFLSAFRHWDRIGAFDNPGAWVRRVVSNRAVSLYRRKAAEARAMLRMGGEDYTVSEPDAEAIHLWNEIRRLPRRQSQVMALRYYDQLPIADIALILERSETTVKTHIQRAKKALVLRLEGENPK